MSLAYHTSMSERSLTALLIILVGVLGILGYAVYMNVWESPQTNTNTAQPLDFDGTDRMVFPVTDAVLA